MNIWWHLGNIFGLHVFWFEKHKGQRSQSHTHRTTTSFARSPPPLEGICEETGLARRSPLDGIREENVQHFKGAYFVSPKPQSVANMCRNHSMFWSPGNNREELRKLLEKLECNTRSKQRILIHLTILSNQRSPLGPPGSIREPSCSPKLHHRAKMCRKTNMFRTTEENWNNMLNQHKTTWELGSLSHSKITKQGCETLSSSRRWKPIENLHKPKCQRNL